jgi:hypothetical protein
MPELAMQKSAAGAKAFVRQFVDVLNYSWQSLSTEELRLLALRTCRSCAAGANAIDRVGNAGGFKHGAEWRVTAIASIPTQQAEPLVQAAIHVAKGTLKKSASSAPRALKPALLHADFQLSWRSGGWRVANLEVR